MSKELIYKDDALACVNGAFMTQTYKAIEAIPAVDAVKVVPCESCKCWYRCIVDGIEYVNFSRCARNHGGNGGNFFCADGERKDNGRTDTEE